VVLNAGLALALSSPDSGSDGEALVRDVRAGMDRAEQALDSGAASAQLQSWVDATQRTGQA
jgi:anthranilate phosphoribosyltransferase